MRRGALLTALMMLLWSAPAVALAAPACPSSIDQAVAVSERGDPRSFALSALPRDFPQIPTVLSPGARGADAVDVHGLSARPVDVSFRISGEVTAAIPHDEELVIRILWDGRTVVRGSYADLVGTSHVLGAVDSRTSRTLEVRVELPAHEPHDNVTQQRHWPLDIVLGARSGDGCEGSPTSPAPPSTPPPTPAPPGTPGPTAPGPGPTTEGPTDSAPASPGGPSGGGPGSTDEVPGRPAADPPDDAGPLARTGITAGGAMALALLLLVVGAALRRMGLRGGDRP